VTEDSPRLRIGVLGVVAFALFAVLFGRLWYLQVMVAPRFEQAARVSQVRVIQIAPTRGRILDRNGVVLAENKLTTVVTVDRSVIASTKARTALFAKLAPILGQTPVQLEGRYNDNQYSPLLPLPLTTIKDALLHVRAPRRACDRLHRQVVEGSRHRIRARVRH
jgi:cell division protein FtsI/penicillin-binding protein 2